MGKIRFNEEHKGMLDSFLLEIDGVVPGKMFGYPAYYVGGKLFASFYEDGVCVKVPESMVKELLERQHIVPFRPMGRTMRAWIRINREISEDYMKDRDIFDASIEFVSSLAKKGSK